MLPLRKLMNTKKTEKLALAVLALINSKDKIVTLNTLKNICEFTCLCV